MQVKVDPHPTPRPDDGDFPNSFSKISKIKLSIHSRGFEWTISSHHQKEAASYTDPDNMHSVHRFDLYLRYEVVS